MELKQILPASFDGPIEENEFVCIEILKKDTAAIMKSIATDPRLQYKEKFLKRIKNHTKDTNLVLLGRKDLVTNLEDYNLLFNLSEYELLFKKLPTEIPVLRRDEIRKQYEWPITFKDNPLQNYIECINTDNSLSSFLSKNEKLWDDSSNTNHCIIFDPFNHNILAQTSRINCPSSSIDHVVMRALELVGSLHKDTQPLLNKREPFTDELGNIESSGNYVCANLAVLVKMEPCIMCSMALTHSRIKYLIYRDPHPHGWGGCNTNIQIFCDERLNHQYKVYLLSKR